MLNVTKFILGEIETNTYVLESNGEYAVVDPAVKSCELENFLEGKNVRWILLTHGHFDHISGVKSLVEKTGAKVTVHSLDDEMLYDGNKSLYASHFGTAQPEITASVLTEDGDEINLGNTVLRVMYTPGHTMGSVCFVCDENRIIFSGDTLFRLSAGRTDLAGINPIKAGRLELESLQKLAELKGDYTVYPGHGESTTLQFERENNRYMRNRNAFNSY